MEQISIFGEEMEKPSECCYQCSHDGDFGVFGMCFKSFCKNGSYSVYPVYIPDGKCKQFKRKRRAIMNIVYNTDCLPAMKEFPNKYFDLAVVDPPYFSGPERRGCYGSSVSTTKIKRRCYPVTDHWQVPTREYFDELLRISKRYIIFGCNYFDYQFAPGRIVWDKCNGASTFSDCEIAATNCHDSVRLFRYMWNGMMQGKNMYEGHIMRGNKAENEERIHTTQKPLDLYRWIFTKYAQRGDRIIDTHIGSGTSRRAASEFGLDFIGYEIEKIYFDLQEQAFFAHTAQLRFDF